MNLIKLRLNKPEFSGRVFGRLSTYSGRFSGAGLGEFAVFVHDRRDKKKLHDRASSALPSSSHVLALHPKSRR